VRKLRGDRVDLNDLQYFTQTAFSRLGVSNRVQVIPTNANFIAMALGLTTDMTLPGMPPGKTSLGVISVNLNQLYYFDQQECYFIIAYECAHIYSNHLISRAFWACRIRK
jgi:hypothetical protein